MLFISVLFLMLSCLFIAVLWSPAGKGLTAWLSFVMSNCKVVTFPLESWVNCGARLYRFLIFAFFCLFNGLPLHNYNILEDNVNHCFKDLHRCRLCIQCLDIFEQQKLM